MESKLFITSVLRISKIDFNNIEETLQNFKNEFLTHFFSNYTSDIIYEYYKNIFKKIDDINFCKDKIILKSNIIKNIDKYNTNILKKMKNKTNNEIIDILFDHFSCCLF